MKFLLKTCYGYFCLIAFCFALTLKERKEFLDIHNYLRRSVFPTASDMQELIYDENIEKHVTEYLEKCVFEHRRLDNYGENGRLSSDNNITNSVVSWFQERIYFNIFETGDKRCSKKNTIIDYLPDSQCGHYKMMVKSTLKGIGCGHKFCTSATSGDRNYSNVFLTFCFYDSGQKDQPYEIGNICSDCDNAYQFCHDDLCVPKKRYDKISRSCKVVCKNCAPYFDPMNSCLCDCPLDTDGNSCKGNSTIANCPFCKKKGLACVNGIENQKDKNCSCICEESFEGKQCEINKRQFSASYYHVIDGLPWRHGMNIPVNLLEFKNSYSEFQRFIHSDILNYCKHKESNEDCQKIKNIPLNSNNVLPIQGFPLLLENGSLALRIFFNLSVSLQASYKENLVSSALLGYVLNNPSKELEKLIDNSKRIYPIRNPPGGCTNKLTFKFDVLLALLIIFLWR